MVWDVDKKMKEEFIQDITKALNKEMLKKELVALCAKYEINISGCGCCNSPWILDKDGELVFEGVSVTKERLQHD